MSAARQAQLTDERKTSHATEGLRQAARDILADGGITPGYFKMQLAKGAIWSPVRIWQGFGWEPKCHHARGLWCWRALLNGAPVRLERVWPACVWFPIRRTEYHYRLSLFRHAVRHEPNLPEASPHQKVNFEELEFDFVRMKEQGNGDQSR